jgi:hypothetical protein
LVGKVIKVRFTDIGKYGLSGHSKEYLEVAEQINYLKSEYNRKLCLMKDNVSKKLLESRAIIGAKGMYQTLGLNCSY